METLLGDEHGDEHYRSASEHGLAWFLLNKMIHLIVLIYTSFGLVRFQVKSIHVVELVKCLAPISITYNWYISIKFAMLASLLYFLDAQLESNKISISQFNCSLSNGRRVFQEEQLKQSQQSSSDVTTTFATADRNNNNTNNDQHNHRNDTGIRDDDHLTLELQIEIQQQRLPDPTLIDYLSSPSSHYPLILASLIDNLGGPYKLLGNQATLIYGFYSISIGIMLAIFPLELLYHSVGFNYIRFILNNTDCLREFYERKRKHLERLNNWSRNKNTSMLTLGMKKAINRRKLRCLYVLDCKRFAEQMIVSHLLAAGGRSARLAANGHGALTTASKQVATGKDRSANLKHQQQVALMADVAGGVAATGGARDQLWAHRLASTRQMVATVFNGGQAAFISSDEENGRQFHETPLKSLRHSLSTNHHDQPSYDVKVANKNLVKFKPHVRAGDWFKFSMLVYPLFVFYYFSSMMLIIGSVSVFITRTLKEISENCARNVNNNIDLLQNWNLYDSLTFLETQYAVFALSCASSFYCSYYFGNITEALIWIVEIFQQLDLCRLVLQLTYEAPRSMYAPPLTRNYLMHRYPSITSSTTRTTNNNNDDQEEQETAGCSGGVCFKRTNPRGAIAPNATDSYRPVVEKFFFDALSAYHGSIQIEDDDIDQYCNQFGGIRTIWSQFKFYFASQSSRLKRRELMAIRLISKKQTLLRATYININLFFDELNGTRYITQTILRRTIQIAFAFALLLAITRSQFSTSFMGLNFLFAACLTILNLYLVCAATINNWVNKLLPRIHGVIGASIVSGTDNDLLEFWLRQIQAYGSDKDAMSYKIYGYKVTWSSILNVSVSWSILFNITNFYGYLQRIVGANCSCDLPQARH